MPKVRLLCLHGAGTSSNVRTSRPLLLCGSLHRLINLVALSLLLSYEVQVAR